MEDRDNRDVSPQDASSRDTPSQDASPQDASSQDTSSQDTSSQDTSPQETPSQEASPQDTPSREASSQPSASAASDETASAPVDSVDKDSVDKNDKPADKPAPWLVRRLRRVQMTLYNAQVTFQNRVIRRLPGARPEWVVYEMQGSYQARERPRKFLQIPPQLGPMEPTLESLERDVRALARAPWLTGVTFRTKELSLDLSTAHALRNLLGILRDAGKKSRVYISSLDTASYYFASAADEVVVPESGELFVLGVGVEQFYLRNLLARAGISFDVLAVREYKTAFEPLTSEQMSEAQREQTGAFVQSAVTTFEQEVAERRAVSADTVQGWLEDPPISAEAARELGMIDTVAYEDELIGKDDKPFREIARLLPVRRKEPSKRVAVISLEGAIVTGTSRRSPFPIPVVGEQAGSETLQQALRQAIRDPQTAAIVLYVDSGGGSALASDLIGREVMRATQHKPVVAVMGSVAASGGYYVLTHANVVMALPTTLTGSIGVIVGKPVLEEVFERYGVNSERLEPYPLALAFSTTYPFDDKQRDWLERYTDDVYQRFVTRVSEGRGLSRDDVDAIGRGRIWSGVDALKRGLIDELGDLPAAIAKAKELAELPESAPVYNVRTPSKLLLPTEDDPSTLLRSLKPLIAERTLLLCAERLRTR